ncbi:MAG: hypothetical protein QOE63_1593, partial [Acidimicrobiaceae bacterium]
MTASAGRVGVGTADATEPVLRELLDTHQIRNVLLRYARGLDRGDWDLVR